MTTTSLRDVRIIDSDTHVVEPPDLWTSRVSARWGDLVPHVAWDPDANEEIWLIGGDRVSAVGSPAMAGWGEYPPRHPRRWEDVNPTAWDASKRLAMMDDLGIHAQILYPNITALKASSIVQIKEPRLQLECVRAYNDFQIEWGSVAPDRFIAMASLPFWDMEATLAEVERSAGLGHRGVIMTQNPAHWGLPPLTSSHWDPLWASAQEKGMPVNFHVGTGDPGLGNSDDPTNGQQANFVTMNLVFFLENSNTVSKLICGGVCHRFPRLNFVIVESGIGWMPFTVATLDWTWQNAGVAWEHPEYDLLPSEYFKRQIYGCFWFEHETAVAAIEQLGADNFLFETDYPHPTCLYPGPLTVARTPLEHLEESMKDLPSAAVQSVLHDNAARIYNLR